MAVDAPSWLEVIGLTKHYGGVRALDAAGLGLRAGEIHGLVGANGAGKSTLVKCLTGMIRPSSGAVLVDGRPLRAGRPVESLTAGIASVPQELTVAPRLSVADNVMLGHEPRLAGIWVGRGELRRRARQALELVELDVQPDTVVGQLALIQQRLVMVARALSRDARLVIFDEATATLSPHEADVLLQTVRRLARKGVTVLYVSHHLREVEEVCDAVTVLRDGRVAADLHGATHAQLVALLAPRSPTTLRAPRADRRAAGAALEVRNVSGPRLRDVSLRVEPGEIVGLAGLAGSGSRELLLTICGAVPFTDGSIELGGRRIHSGDTLRAVAYGAGFLPGDRSLGLLPRHNVRHNVVLPMVSRLARRGLLNPSAEKWAVAALLERVALAAGTEVPIASLSGGNQQKALVARWIGSGARLLLLDDPTAGVDVATRPEIHAQIRALSGAGVGTVIVSTDAEELAELCERIVVFERGTVAAELPSERLTPAVVLGVMTGDTVVI